MPPSERVENDDNATCRLSFTDLPNEIIARIFSTGTRTWSEGRTPVQEQPFPLLVSNVSMHWRLLAQSTPELWTFIIPPLHRNESFCISETLEWLRRSGSLFVSVVLDVRQGRGYTHEMSAILGKVLLCLTEKATHKLRTLDLYDYDLAHIEPDVLEKLSSAIHLERFSLYLASHPSQVFAINRPFQWEWASRLPNLRTLRVRGPYFPYNPNITYLRVSHLRLTYQDAQDVFNVLPNLTTLALEELLPLSLPLPSDRPLINAHSLKCLAVSCMGNEADSIYLPRILSMPNPTHLELDGVFAMSISVVFGTSISGAKIETLRISNCTPHPPFGGKDEDFRIFHSFAALRHLQIIHTPVTISLFSKMANPFSRIRTRSIRLTKPPGIPGLRANDLGFNPYQGTSASANEAVDPMAQANISWPELHTITLDTLPAADVALLCEFVAHHKSVQTVVLGKSSMRHLSDSIRRHGDKITPIPWRAARLEYDEGARDVQEWLAARVHLTLLPSTSYGLLDSDHFSQTL